MQRFPAGRGRAVVLPEARSEERARVARDDDGDDRQRHAVARARDRRPRARRVGRQPRLPRLPRLALPRRRPRPLRRAAARPRPAARHRLRRRPRRGGRGARRCSTSSASPATRRRRATAGCTSTSGCEPRWDSYAVRSAAVAVARELERRRPDVLTAAWWKEERGERIFVDYNQNAPHKTVFGAWCVRARPGGQVSDAAALGRGLRAAPRRADADDRRGPARRARRPVGGHRRHAAVARAAARAARARSRERPARRAVAAGLPEDAGRAAARRAEPRAQGAAARAGMTPATPSPWRPYQLPGGAAGVPPCSALVLARPRHEREDERGATGDHDGGDVCDVIHAS